MSLPRHAAFSAFAVIVGIGSRFTFIAVAARVLPQSTFGQFAYSIWLVDVAFLACSLGMHGIVSRYVAEYRGDAPQLAALMLRWRRWAFAPPLLAGMAVAVGAQVSDLNLSRESLVLLIVWAIVQAICGMQTAALTGGQRFDKVLLASILTALTMIIGIVLLPAGSSPLSRMFLIMTAASVVGAMTGCVYVHNLGRGTTAVLSKEQWRSIRSYGLNIWLTSLLWTLVWSRGEFPVVRAFVGDEGVALYAAAMTVFAGAMQGVMLGVYGVIPHLTRLWGEGHVQEAITSAREVMEIQLLACGGVSILVVCFGNELMVLAFGNEYREGAEMLVILGPGLLAMALAAQNHVLQVATDARFNRNSSLLGVTVLMGLAISLIPIGGLNAAAMTRSITMAILGAVSMFGMIRRWKQSAVPLAKFVGVYAICVVTAVAVKFLGEHNLGWRLSVFLVGGSIIGIIMRDSHGGLLLIQSLRWLFGRAGSSSAETGARQQ